MTIIKTRKSSTRSGFTLIELLVVIAIIASPNQDKMPAAYYTEVTTKQPDPNSGGVPWQPLNNPPRGMAARQTCPFATAMSNTGVGPTCAQTRAIFSR